MFQIPSEDSDGIFLLYYIVLLRFLTLYDIILKNMRLIVSYCFDDNAFMYERKLYL